MDGQSSLFDEWFQRYGLFSNHPEYALRYLEPQLEFYHRDGVGEPHWERDYKAQTRGYAFQTLDSSSMACLPKCLNFGGLS